MSRYILDETYALRGWSDHPFMLIKRGDTGSLPLKRAEFLCLCSCDGKEELEDSELIKRLCEEGVIHPSKSGETLSSWQSYHFYPNIHFDSMTIEITERCNYSCLHCFNAADAGNPGHELSLEEIDNILDQAKEAGVTGVVLTGGEPMIHRDFRSILKHIKEKGMIVDAINTNGYYLNDEILDFMRAEGISPWLKISFDGKGFHDWMRGCPGAEERALEAIKRSVSKGFRTYVQMNLNRRNIDTVMPTLAMMNELGVNITRLIRTTEAPRWLANAGKACLSWSEYYEKCLEILSEYSRMDPSMNLLLWMFANMDPAEKTIISPRVKSVCGGNYERDCLCRNRLDISASMKVYPCLQMSGGMSAVGIVPGDLRKKTLRGLLHESLYSDLVELTVLDKKENNEDCRACPYVRWCHGGCPALAVLTQSRFFGRDDSACIFYRGDYARKIMETLPDYTWLSPVPDQSGASYFERLSLNEFSPGLDGVDSARLLE